jgi:hypothetical protein
MTHPPPPLAPLFPHPSADNFKPRTAGYTGFTPRDPKYSSAVVDKPKGVEATSEHDHYTGFVEGMWASVRDAKAASLRKESVAN